MKRILIVDGDMAVRAQIGRYAVWLGIIEKLDTPFDSAGCFA